MYLPANLRYLRRKHNLSQTDLGDKVGVEYSAISRYERGSATPSLEKTTLLAQVFDISIEQLRNTDLSQPPASLAAEPTRPYDAPQPLSPLASRPRPGRQSVQVIIELDGTEAAFERAVRLIAAFNEAVSEAG